MSNPDHNSLTVLARRLKPLLQGTIYTTPPPALTGRQVIAGAGLTGGGDLSADITLAVGAGGGIVVSADAVAVGQGDGLTVGAGAVALTTPGTLAVGSANSASGSHTHAVTSSANPGAAAALLASSAAGALTLVNFGVSGNVTSDWIPSLPDTYDLGSTTKLWRKGYLSELDTVLFAAATATLFGGWSIIGHDAGTLAADVAAAATQVDFGDTMTPGDFVVLRGMLMVEYMQVGTLVSGTTYNVTRNLDGTGANDWPAGTPYLVLGTTGDGRIELVAYEGPKIKILEQGATYNAQTERLRIGDMRNAYGTGANDSYGIGIGDYSAGNYLSYNAETANAFVLKAGAGSITLDADGLAIAAASALESNRAIRFVSGGRQSFLHMRDDATTLYTELLVDGVNGGGRSTWLNLWSWSTTNAGTEQAQARIGAGFVSGSHEAYIHFVAHSTTEYIDLYGGAGGVRVQTGQFTAKDDIIAEGDVYTVQWADYSATSTVTGWSSYDEKKIYYKKIGNLVFVLFSIDGTSDSTSASFTVPYQRSSSGPYSLDFTFPSMDNGAYQAAPGLAQFGFSTNTITLLKSTTSTSWTASGRKLVRGQFWYEVA